MSEEKMIPEETPPEEALAEILSAQANEVSTQLQDLIPETPAASPAPLNATPVEEEITPEVIVEAEPIVSETVARDSLSESAAMPTPAQRTRRLLEPGEPMESNSDDRMLSALAWGSMALLQLPIVSVVQLLSETTRHRRFQQHHAVTSLLFFIASFAYEIVAALAYTILGALTLGCGYACLWVIFLAPHALALYFALQAYNGKTVELPGLSSYARKQGWL